MRVSGCALPPMGSTAHTDGLPDYRPLANPVPDWDMFNVSLCLLAGLA